MGGMNTVSNEINQNWEYLVVHPENSIDYIYFLPRTQSGLSYKAILKSQTQSKAEGIIQTGTGLIHYNT